MAKAKELTVEDYKKIVKKLLKDMDENGADMSIWYGDATGALKQAVIEAGYESVFEN